MKTKSLFYGILLLFCLSLTLKSEAQDSGQSPKPVVDTNCFGRWPSTWTPSISISNDGKYSAFPVTVGRSNYLSDIKQTNKNYLSIVSNSAGWKIDIAGASIAYFSNNSRQAYFMKEKDSLGILDLKAKALTYVPNVAYFQFAKKGDWMACLSKTPKDRLILYNTATGKTANYSGITAFQFSKDGKVLLLTTKAIDKTIITWVELNTGKTTKIWQGGSVFQPTFDHSSNGLAFIAAENQSNIIAFAICYYVRGTVSAQSLADNKSTTLNGKFTIANSGLLFSKRDDRILFQIDTSKQQVNQNLTPKYKNVDIWGYKDPFTQAVQHHNPDAGQTTYNAVVNLQNKNVILLNHEGEALDRLQSFEDQFVVRKGGGESRYIIENQPTYYLVSAQTGNRKTIIEHKALYGNLQLSPDGCYVIWYNDDSLAYFSYEIVTGVTRNISKSVPSSLLDQDEASAGKAGAIYGIAGWTENGHHIYIYDHWDIWKVDLNGSEPAVNITSGYGKRQGLVFGVVNFNPRDDNFIINSKAVLLLSAFDPQTKDNGFYKLNVGGNTIPEKLSMGPYAEYISRTGDFGHVSVPGMLPVKAKDSQTYLVTRQRANLFPNLYVTHDFKSFKQISDLQPEKDYNWMSSELVTWKMPNGRSSQGILYKPENFDRKKKYPVIFVYYEEKSDGLNAYLEPDWTGDEINIPYFVSNGYLVVRPDIIFYKKYHDGQEIVNSVVSGAKYLSKLLYVDSTKMGIDGHSYGGWETNYLVTHTHLFAAAATASGPSDEITNYFIDNGWNGIPFYESTIPGSPYLDVTPYTNPDLFMRNSPVFYVNNATTPLLIEAGYADPGVLFREATQMFLAMRRAGKKCWLLQYDNASHVLYNNDAKDYTIRLKQFFDHYLKGLPPPVWMTKGVALTDKGKDDGLEPDLSGAKP